MLRTRKCPLCGSIAKAQIQNYPTGKLDKHASHEIIVEDVEVFNCENSSCNHVWLPIDQERRIDQTVANETRFDLMPSEISLIRESLPFSTKFQTANFLCLNQKAFTKWELGYSGPNRAYDLLLRLSVFSRQNFAFIQHLHETNFQFNPDDYQLICDHHNLEWSFNVLQKKWPTTATSGSITLSNVIGDNLSVQEKLECFTKGAPTRRTEANEQEVLAA